MVHGMWAGHGQLASRKPKSVCENEGVSGMQHQGVCSVLRGSVPWICLLLVCCLCAVAQSFLTAELPGAC